MYDRQASQLQPPYQQQPQQYIQSGLPRTGLQSQQHPSSHSTPPPASQQITPHPIPSTTAQQPHIPHAYLPQYQAPQQVHSQENKQLYPHQQYFQNPQMQPPASQALVQMQKFRDFPDVPVDSSSIIERVMTNLRKAA
jgi:hypothetical protein